MSVVELDSSMAGQIVDCGCGKKLRVPTVKSNAVSPRHAAGGGRDDASVSEQDSNSSQSFSPKERDQVHAIMLDQAQQRVS